MTAAELLAERVVPLWLEPAQITGHPLADATKALGRQYRKADGVSRTQFNTGALVIRHSQVLALTECQPLTKPASLIMRPPTNSRAAVIQDIRENGPPLLVVRFAKGAFDIHRWACSTPDEVVLNGLAGPDEAAAMNEVAVLRSLPKAPRDWRRIAGLCALAMADLTRAAELHEEAGKLAKKLSLPRARVLELAHRFHAASGLTFELATEAA